MRFAIFELRSGKHFFAIDILDINYRSLFGIFYNWKRRKFMIGLLFFRIHYYKGWTIK